MDLRTATAHLLPAAGNGRAGAGDRPDPAKTTTKTTKTA
jgi:hypothetical protein